MPILVWLATLIAVAVVDVTAYLAAAGRAQSLADGAALAAVAPDARPGALRSARAEADRVVTAGDGALERCICRTGTRRATVEVSVAVPGLVIPELGAARVVATGHAGLAPPDTRRIGPTPERLGTFRPP